MAQRLSIRTNNRTLTSLLQYIKQGSIQVPQFQRGFVWEKDNVKKLFDSINKGYPVGTVYLWKPEDQSESVKESKLGAYTIPNEGHQEYYVLDGYQRLSTLFNCLINSENSALEFNENEWNKYFNLYYDAKINEFIYLGRNQVPKYHQFPLQVMLMASDFRKYYREHLEKECDSENEIEDILNKADGFCSRLLDYTITCTEIENADISQAADIFSRINKEGTKVSIDWMIHALSYDKASGFNLAKTTDDLIDSLQPYRFEDISRNAIFRCFQSSFDNKIFFDQDKIEKLARQKDFRTIIEQQSVPAIKKAVQFLYEDLHVIDRKLLPYSSQLIFIMEFFRRLGTPSDEQKNWLKQWFWLTSYTSFFTISSLADQRKEFSHFIKSIDDRDFSQKTTSFFAYLRSYNMPNNFNVRGVRSCTLALYVINNLFANCPEIMKDAMFRPNFISPFDNSHAPRCTMFTDVESKAYDRYRYHPSVYNQKKESLFSAHIFEIETDKKVLESSFFDIDDIDNLVMRESRMIEAETEFIKKIGIVIEDLS